MYTNPVHCPTLHCTGQSVGGSQNEKELFIIPTAATDDEAAAS